MNILPTGPHTETDIEYDRYFADLKRWNFDVAYNAHYAFPLRDVLGRLEEPYRKFARRARAEGVRSCVQIQSTVANSDDVPLTETQRYVDNQYFIYEHFEGEGKKNHFGSFASPVWLEHLKTLTRTFRDYGYDWVVFEEPMFLTDIPGPDDPLRRRFSERYPDLEFPSHQAESAAYLALQALKRDVLTEFYAELCRYAKSLGFEMVGIMPWFFTPTFENTPPETWNTSCDTGRITFLPDLDFIIVRMQPDNISGQAMVAATGESRPILSYYECLAHALGKPLIMVNNPTDEHRPENWGAPSLIPYDFFRRYTLAAAAAAPQGMSRHWYGKDYENDTRHMELMTEVNDLLRRLGPASCEIAFVYSFAGASHVWPRPWREVWRAYWTFAQQMVEGEHIPFLTFFAESLRECLERHPEVRVIVLNEFFPIPPAEVELLEEWLAGGAGGRRIVYIGGRDGYCWEGPLYTDFRMRPPEMSRLVGIDPEQPVRRIHPDPETRVTYMGNDGTNAFAGEEFLFSPPVVGVPGFLREGAPDALYVLRDEENVPLVTRRRVSGGGEAWFLAFPLEGSIDEFPFGSLFRELLGTAAAFGSKPYVEQASPGVLFNFTANGYLVVVNCTKRAAQLGLSTAVRAWDVSAEAYVATLQTVELEPLAIRLFRLLEEGRRVLDVRKPVLVEELREVRDGVEFAGRLHSGASVLLSARPDRVEVNGSPCAPDLREGPSGTWELFPPVSPGDRCRITVHFREAGAG